MHKILHIAALNFAGVPYSFCEMHNACGDYSRLITLHKNNVTGFREDICLGFPLPDNILARMLRSRKIARRRSMNGPAQVPVFEPRNILEKTYYHLMDLLRMPAVRRAIRAYNCADFDIIHYDSGLDFYRTPHQARAWKKQGKKIVCCYYGSDLRIRGIIKEMDSLADLSITSEYDHLALKPDLEYIFYPYNSAELPEPLPNESDTVRIVHSPTNRAFKGTDIILEVIGRIQQQRKITFHLLEGRPRQEVLGVKRGCDICIDQVGGAMGGTGYGKAGIETLAMGIPTITNMTCDYSEWLPENPFVVANDADTLYDRLIELIDSPSLRRQLGARGQKWVHAYHGFGSVNSRLMSLYRTYGIIS